MRLAGSHHVALRGSRVVAGSRDDEEITVSLGVRPRVPAPDVVDDPAMASPPAARVHATRDEHAARHGADAADVDHVARWARRAGLEVIERATAARRLKVRGSAGAIGRLFGVKPVWYEHARRDHRGYDGPIHLPEEIASRVVSVLGLADRPCARPRPAFPPGGAAPLAVTDLAAIYAFPPMPERGAPTIGVIELGGGYHPSDLDLFFRAMGQPVPEITDVPVGSARNHPAAMAELHTLGDMLLGKAGAKLEGAALDHAMWTFETTMDLQILGALAPGAKLVVYFARDDEQGIVDALTAALLHGPHQPSIVSMSWSEPEPDLPAHVLEAAHDVVKDSAHLGVTLCGSAGDQGSGNGIAGATPSVSFPASSPYVLACGGTTLLLSGRTCRGEEVWNARFHGREGATGGGVSTSFPRPAWQHDLAVPRRPAGGAGRGVPDVAANADPATGCRIVVGGRATVTSGTSAVAPTWAALLARLEAALGHRIGYLNPLLYRLAREDPALLRDVTHGGNGAYDAARGWDPCTGFGSPHGRRLLDALRGDGR